MTEKPLIWAPFFSTKNLFYTFCQRWLYNFDILLKTYFRNLFRKTVKNGGFTLLNKPLEPYKLPLRQNGSVLLLTFPKAFSVLVKSEKWGEGHKSKFHSNNLNKEKSESLFSK